MGIPKITWMFDGKENGYYVLMDGQRIYFTHDSRDCDLFAAELTGRLKMAANRMERSATTTDSER